MASNISARAATSGELVKFRSNGDWVKLGLAIQHPVTVYTARINQVFTAWDGIVELTYDGGAGTLADVLQHMTAFIGSAAGLYDKGICRIRKTPTATVFYISQTSDIQFMDNDFITIVDAIPLAQRDISDVGGIVKMDYDIEFGSYLNGGALPRIGPLVAVINQTSGTITFTPVDPSLSACYDGATVASYLFDAPGASTTSNMTSPTTASWTYPLTANQEYRWSCAITDSLGRVTIAYRRVFVNPTTVDFILESCSGDFDSGDWSFEVTCLSGVARNVVYDRALVTLYESMAIYDNVSGSIGKIAGYENIKCSGWIDGESITYDPESGDVTFTVSGPAYWFEKIRAFPFELQDTTAAPANWKQIQTMTADKAMAHSLFWMSTAPVVMDCFFSGDTTRQKIFVQSGESLLEQIKSIASKIFAVPLVNNYCQLYVEVDQQIISAAARATLPVVMDITKPDRLGELDIERIPTPRTSLIELSAISAYDGAIASPIYSRAPGNTGKRYGEISSYDNFVIIDQAECNRISGCLLAIDNNEYEPLAINLASNNGLLDIAPHMYCMISIAVGDTPRGIVLANVRLIPRKINYEYDKENGVLSTIAVFVLEVIGVDGVTYVPITIGDPVDDLFTGDGGGGDGGDLEIIDTDFPDIIYPPVDTPCDGTAPNQFSIGWDKSLLDGGDPTKLIARAYFPCRLRSNIYLRSQLAIGMTFYGDAESHFSIYGIKGGARVISASPPISANYTVSFQPTSDLEVDGFEIELEAGLGSPVEYVPMDVVLSGAVAATDSNGVAVACTSGELYGIETIGGPWFNGATNRTFTNWLANAGDHYTTGLTYVFSEITAESSVPGEPYTRKYFYAPASNVGYFRCYDDYFVDNSGSISYILRNAEVRGRRIYLGGITLVNVCAI